MKKKKSLHSEEDVETINSVKQKKKLELANKGIYQANFKANCVFQNNEDQYIVVSEG